MSQRLTSIPTHSRLLVAPMQWPEAGADQVATVGPCFEAISEHQVLCTHEEPMGEQRVR